MKRNKKNVRNNIASNKVYSELPTVSAGEYAKELSVYTDKNGNKAVVPQGWTVSGVPKENTIWGKDKGLVIYHIPESKVSGIDWQNPDEIETLMRTYNQFVWTPAGLLTARSTLDGIHFKEKFGRRIFDEEKFSKRAYHEPLVDELVYQKESVDKYGGFYISRYNISENSEGKPQSVKGAIPWVDICFDDAKKAASTVEDNEAVKSHLIFGAEYDTVLKWLMESKTKTRMEIVFDSNEWGHYLDFLDYNIAETGSEEKWCANNIYDLAGNVGEWTQEETYKEWPHEKRRVLRGGGYSSSGDAYTVSSRGYKVNRPLNFGDDETGFRVALCIK